MSEPDFIHRQYRFAAHIRDPQHQPLPAGVEERRMAVYRELFYNNIEDFLARAFPVLRELMQDTEWHAMVRDFLVRHRCRSPLFAEIPREFLAYLEQERGERDDDPPFLQELAHYEWLELALSIAEGEPPAATAADGDVLEGVPQLSPLARMHAYRYPVHRIGPDYRPQTPGEQPTYLLVYRDAEDEVGFIELNAVSARLFSLLQEQSGASGRQLLLQIADELRHPRVEAVVEGGREILEAWQERNIISAGPART
ncbi:MAG TPA: DUF2063 domain-containing protein [Gammaproteobacteria bacterium]|nr:DUF2063 domain-containing protein [Gammaproteobacteria bacterium]